MFGIAFEMQKSGDDTAEDTYEQIFEISFFRAPWKRNQYRGPAHYCIIGLVCATYLFAVGGYLTYTVFWGDSGTSVDYGQRERL